LIGTRIGFLTVITAAVTSAFVECARRRLEGTRTDTLSAKLDQIGTRLDVIGAGLKNIGGPPRCSARIADRSV